MGSQVSETNSHDCVMSFKYLRKRLWDSGFQQIYQVVDQVFALCHRIK